MWTRRKPVKFSTDTAPDEFLLPYLRLRSSWSRSFFHLLALGGRRPEGTWMRTVANRSSSIWAADAGLGLCLDEVLEPERVFGDFDSLPKRYGPWLENHQEKLSTFPVEKDLTDFQLALQACCNASDNLVVVTGCWGGRFDHAWCNVMTLRWGLEQGWNSRIMADEREFLGVLKSSETMELHLEKTPKALSLLPLCDRCEGVSIDGVRWELQNATLCQGHPYSVSNKAKGRSLRISLTKGLLGVYLCWHEN